VAIAELKRFRACGADICGTIIEAGKYSGILPIWFEIQEAVK
jgi:hypothetical protein